LEQAFFANSRSAMTSILSLSWSMVLCEPFTSALGTLTTRPGRI
jgi:hypothetical protein